MMEGGRITADPRPCSGRRVLSKRGGGEGFLKKIQRREIGSKQSRRAFRLCPERFTNIRLQVFDLLFTSLFL